MKKFIFELEEILNVRAFEQQQAEVELGKALAEEQRIQNQLDNLAMNQIKTQKEMKGSTNFQDIANASQFYTYVRNQKEKLLSELTQAKIITEEKRNILKSAIQKTDALKDLKEQQFYEFKEEAKRREQIEMDNIVTGRFKPKAQYLNAEPPMNSRMMDLGGTAVGAIEQNCSRKCRRRHASEYSGSHGFTHFKSGSA